MSELDISIVVPAYNEEDRLPPTLADITNYFDSTNLIYEVIVVNDGSSDNTTGVVERFIGNHSHVKLHQLEKNYGKGRAVRTGMLAGSGRFLLFTDADGSTPTAEFHRLFQAIDKGADIAIGSRALASEDTAIETVFYRKYLGRMFNFCVNAFLLPGYADTQCGFKLFKREAAHRIFEYQQADGFSFDLEVLYLAKKLGFVVEEVPINWRNVAGSKVNLAVDATKMLFDMFVFRARHREIKKEAYTRRQ